MTGARYPWIVAASALVNQYYCYGLDLEFGPFFVKFSSYFPYGAKLCFNGHHWAQRQAGKAGIAFTALDKRVSLLRGPSGAAADLRPAVGLQDRSVLSPLAGAAAAPLHGR